MKEVPYSKTLSLAERLAIINAKAEYMQKDGSGFGYKYATPEAVLGFFKPLLQEYRVGFGSSVRSGSVAVDRLSKDGKGDKTNEHLISIEMEMMFVNLDNQDSIRIPWWSFGQNTNEKGYGSALTYGLRYFFLNYFMVPTGNDDPDKYHAPITTPEATKKKKESAPLDLNKVKAYAEKSGITIAQVESKMGSQCTTWVAGDRDTLITIINDLKDE